ncbi:TPA: toll/interleukin-1 receptor domain-containing protein [Streptococcus suis]
MKFRDEEIEKFVSDYLLDFLQSDSLILYLDNSKTGNLLNPIVRLSFIKRLINYIFYVSSQKIMIHYFYETEYLMIVRIDERMKEVTILIPYEDYDKYFDFIYELNQLVSSDGYIEVFVNNIYYQLEFGVAIITSQNFEEIKYLAEQRGLTLDYSKNLKEITAAQRYKGYNSATLGMFFDRLTCELTIRSLFTLPPKSKYLEAGFKEERVFKPKLFVSYCHADKGEVHSIISDLREYGLDFWLDEEQIDIGDRILDKVEEGMRGSDLPIIFISHSTKNSLFASHELKTYFSDIIYSQSTSKPWFIIKLDDVNPDDIVKGLGMFMYYDFSSSVHDTENLANRIKRKLRK